MTTQKRCGKCTFLDVKPDADGVCRPRKNKVYSCVARHTDLTRLVPSSVRLRIDRIWMEPYDGESCPLFTPKG